MIDASLQDTAAVTVSADLDAGTSDSIVDKLATLSAKACETLLNDVVAVEVFDKSHNLVGQGCNDHVNLLIGVDKFDHLLESSSAVLVHSDLRQTGRCCSDELVALLIVAVLEQLLA